MITLVVHWIDGTLGEWNLFGTPTVSEEPFTDRYLSFQTEEEVPTKFDNGTTRKVTKDHRVPLRNIKRWYTYK